MTTHSNFLSILLKKNLDEFVSIWTNDRQDYSYEGTECHYPFFNILTPKISITIKMKKLK